MHPFRVYMVRLAEWILFLFSVKYQGHNKRWGHDRLAQCDGGQPAGLSSWARGAAEVQVSPGFHPRGLLQRSALCGSTRYATHTCPSTYPSIHLSIHPSILHAVHPCIHPWMMHPIIHSSSLVSQTHIRKMSGLALLHCQCGRDKRLSFKFPLHAIG